MKNENERMASKEKAQAKWLKQHKQKNNGEKKMGKICACLHRNTFV